MSGAEVLDVGRDAIWLTIQLCAPILIVGLVVGVGIGLLQALTQIQEATLVYAPKIVAVFISLLVFLPLMGALMSGFMKTIAARIVERPGHAAVLVGAPSPAPIVVARAQDVTLDSGGVLRTLVDRHGGKGGGRPELAQGGGITAPAADVLQSARTLIAELLNS